MFKKLEELEKRKCPICGEKAKYNFCHYGDINDCTDVKLTWDIKEKMWIIPSKLTEEQEKELKYHIIKKDRAIKTERTDKKVAMGIVGRIDGTDISQMRCRRVQSDQDNIDAKVGDDTYMINIAAVLRMANEFRFDVVQGDKHKYLTPVEKSENGRYVDMDK